MRSSGPLSETRPRALILAPESPYPLIGGGALRSASVLEFLTQHFEVDLIVFQQPGGPDPSDLIDHPHVGQVHAIRLPFHSRDPVTKVVRNGIRVLKQRPPLIDRFSGFESQIAGFLQGRRYDLGVIEHFWCAHYVQVMEEHCARLVLDLHNVESVWHDRCAEADSRVGGPFLPLRLAHEVFRDACVELERRYLPRFSCVLTTSAADADQVRRISPGVRLSVYPNAVPLVEQPVYPETDTIAFSGSFDYEPNRTAVRYFRREIWPMLRHRWPTLRWRLIGRHPGSIADLIAGDSRIECSGPIEDAVGELARSKIAVVPLLSGSGTRLKIIEAWAAGRAVVSTTIGAEGLPVSPGANIVLADGADAFSEAVCGLLRDPERRQALGAAGRSCYEQDLTWDSAWRRLAAALGSMGQVETGSFR
ncbi:MAG: glycosyltransferase family 4 protein [Bryobacteraceae bacterium]